MSAVPSPVLLLYDPDTHVAASLTLTASLATLVNTDGSSWSFPLAPGMPVAEFVDRITAALRQFSASLVDSVAVD